MSDSARPLGPLILLIVGVLVALAIFWIGFMLAPAAVLLISYLALSAGERGRRQRREELDPPELAIHSAVGAEHQRDGRAEDPRDPWADGLREGQQVEGRRGGQSGVADPVGNQPRGVRA